MKLPAVEYRRAHSADEAVALLTEYGPDSKILAGGQSLIPLMSFRLARPTVLIDLNAADGLDGIRQENGHLVVGAMVRQRTLERSQLAADAVPLIPVLLAHVGHVANRNRGTIGGSVAHADPAAELPALVQALGGEMIVQGPSGTRTVSSEDFFQGTFTTSLGFDDVLTAVRLPCLPDGTGVAVEELARRRGDFAIVGALAAIHVGGDGRVDLARIAVSGVAPVPVRVRDTEERLVGASVLPDGRIDSDVLGAAVNAVDSVIDPTGDVHASGDYRKDMTAVLIRRAVRAAAHQAMEAVR
jgi:carbon-monoxide dehydrogenase medium subunit